MANRLLKIGLLFLALSVLSGAEAMAQIVFGRPPSVDTRITYYHWNLNDENNGSTSFSQFFFPFSAFVPVKDNLEVLVFSAGSVNDIETTGQNSGLTGASDTRLQVNQSLADDRLIISAGVNLPTGKRELEFETDTTFLNILSRNYLSFAMRKFGQGFGGNILVGGAALWGSFRIGLGVMYEYTSSYEPYRDLGDYNPGDFVSLTAGIDKKERKGILFSDVTVSIYSPDRYLGSKTFKQAAQAFFRVGGRYQMGLYQGDISLSYLWRGRNAEYDSNESISQQFQLFGNEFMAQLDLTKHLGSGWAVTPSGQIKLISANEGVGNARLRSSHIVGLGAGVSRVIQDGPIIGVGAKYFVGSANSGAIEIEGVQIYTSVMTTF